MDYSIKAWLLGNCVQWLVIFFFFSFSVLQSAKTLWFITCSFTCNFHRPGLSTVIYYICWLLLPSPTKSRWQKLHSRLVLEKEIVFGAKKRNDLNFLEQSDFFKVLQFFLLCLQYFLLLVLYQSALYFTFGIKHALSFPDLNLLQGNSNHWFDPVLPKGSAWNCTCCWSAPTFGVNGQCNQLLKNIADRQRKALGLFFCYCS